MALLACLGGAGPSALFASELAGVGQPAPAFSLRDTLGQVHELASIVKANRVLVINFWASWCGPCIRELPEFDQVYRKTRAQGVAMLGINAQEPEHKVLAFVRDLDLSFPMLLDSQGTTKTAYGAGPALPVTVLVDSRGLVRQRFQGATTAGALLGRVRALLA